MRCIFFVQFSFPKYRTTLHNHTLFPSHHQLFLKRHHLIFISPAWLSLKIFATHKAMFHLRPGFSWAARLRRRIYIPPLNWEIKCVDQPFQRGEIGRSFGWAQNGLRRPSAKLDSLQSEICLGGGAHVRRLKSPLGKRKTPLATALGAIRDLSIRLQTPFGTHRPATQQLLIVHSSRLFSARCTVSMELSLYYRPEVESKKLQGPQRSMDLF